MAKTLGYAEAPAKSVALAGPRKGHFIMAAILLSLGFFMVWPVFLVLINSFNAAADWFVEPRRWGLDHWRAAYQRPGELFSPLANSLLIWGWTQGLAYRSG